jgi:uncharacterized protein (UPF0332 family)
MGYPHDLLHAAWVISNSAAEDEAIFRRAVSTAYYALFHLLIEDACVNWANADQRRKLGRQFDHRRMKEASAFTAKRSPAGSDLFVVSSTFAHLQERRHEADYDLAVTFSSLDVAVDLSAAELAFQSWERIRQQEGAQGYLFSLLFKDRS